MIFDKIITLFKVWDTRRFIRNIKFLIRNDIGETIFRAKGEAVEDCVFELDELREYFLPRVPEILNENESLSLFEKEPKSIARFGDGEISIMNGSSIAFQKYDPALAEKMLKVLRSKRDDLYIGLNDTYFHAVVPNVKIEHSRIFCWENNTRLRTFFIREIHPDVRYLSARLFVGYFSYPNEVYSAVVERRRRLFEGRKIAVVTGKSVLDKLDYDIFELAASKIYIDAPSKNAFSAYDSIMQDISSNVSKDTLICLILGPTATAMAADLTDMGYMAWDLGHLAKDYDAFMKNTDKTNEVVRDFFSPD